MSRGSVLAIQASFACWRSVRFSGFFHSAYRACFSAFAGPVARWRVGRRPSRGSRCDRPRRASFQASRRTSSRASVAQPHDVERVGAAHRVRASVGDHVGDPVRAVGGDMGDLGASTRRRRLQGVEEGMPGSAVSRPGAAHTSRPRVVVDHHGQVPVAALVGDLVDPDPAQPGERGRCRRSTSAQTRVMIAPDGAPRDPHQLGDRRLPDISAPFLEPDKADISTEWLARTTFRRASDLTHG